MSRTLEDLCLLYAMPELEERLKHAGMPAVAQVSFSGPARGVLEVRVAAAVLPELAGNMLGAMNAPSQEDQLDALGEVANVVCGNFLPVWRGAEAVFDISAPVVCLEGMDAGRPPDGAVWLCLEQGPAEARVYLGEHAAS